MTSGRRPAYFDEERKGAEGCSHGCCLVLSRNRLREADVEAWCPPICCAGRREGFDGRRPPCHQRPHGVFCTADLTLSFNSLSGGGCCSPFMVWGVHGGARGGRPTRPDSTLPRRGGVEAGRRPLLASLNWTGAGRCATAPTGGTDLDIRGRFERAPVVADSHIIGAPPRSFG